MYNQTIPPIEKPHLPSHESKPPRDYLIWSILNVLFGNLIFGIFAIVFSIEARCRNRDGGDKLDEAKTYSKRALIFNIISTCSALFGLICIINEEKRGKWRRLHILGCD